MKPAILGKALIGAILISCPAQSDTRQADLLLTLDFSDERQIRVCISEMLQRVQQLPGASEQSQLPTLFESVANLNSEQATALNGLIAQAEQIAPAGASVHRDWLNTAFQLFSFQIDSVKVSGVIANAYIRPQWRVLPGKGSGAASCVLSFAKADFYWKLSDFSQVTSLLSEYLSANEELIKRAVSESPSASRSTWDDYNNWLNNTALHLLLERDVFPPSFKRFTKANATSQFGHEMFHCTGTPSCYYYEGDPLVGRTVSIAAISDPCWQRFVVADRSNSNDSYIFAKGRVGTGANVDDFAGPRGSEFRAHDLFYICDRGNNRIKVIRIVPTSHQPVLEWTRTGLNGPSDVDVTREGWVIVAEEDGNAIYCYCEASGCTSRRHTYMNSTLGAIDRPTSVALGRNSQSSEKLTHVAYFIDRGGTRLVKVTDPFSATPIFGPSFVSPDPITLMTDVAVDNRGQVWVVDQEKCKIYKFTSSLQLLAIHGGEGDQLAHYQFPRGLGFAQAYRWNSQLQRAEPIPEMAEVMLTEEWGATTGVRRLVSGIDLQSHSVAYRPRLQSGAGDMMLGSFFVTDYCDWTMKFYCNSVLQGQIGQVGQVPGLHSFSWLLPAGAPSGVYQVILDVTSMNIDGNDIQRTNHITVNRSIVNQLPVVTNIWFPDRDSCFLAFVPRIVKAVASDPDGSISQYVWSVTSPFYGSILWSAGDSVMVVSEYYSPTIFGYLGLVVRDNFGEASAAYTLNMSAITRYSASECICTWRPGDADWSHAVSVADAVYIINYVFSGGPSPRPVMMAGDADCNAAISLADAVYVINYIYSGGQPIQCTCSDY